MKYVISDIELFDKEKIKRFSSIENYHDMLIHKWNNVVKTEDEVYLYGVVSTHLIGNDIKDILDKLNGKKFLCEYSLNNNFNYYRWERIGIEKVLALNYYFSSKEKKILFPAEKNYGNDYDYYCVSKRFSEGKVYKNNTLCLAAEYWDYTPILLDNIPQIIENMKNFESMEVQNES